MFLGILAARLIRKKKPELAFDDLLKEKWIGAVSVAVMLILFLLLPANLSDEVCQKYPILIQGYLYSIVINVIMNIFTFFMILLLSYGFIKKSLKKRHITYPIALIIFFVIYYQLDAPLGGIENKKIEGVVLQTTGSTCAAATLANILSLYGHDKREREMALELHTKIIGTTNGQMRYLLSRYNIRWRDINKRSLSLADIQCPAILNVDHPVVGKESHAVAYMKMLREGSYEIWDPLSGLEVWSAKTVAEVWHGTGIECLPNKK
ncbi:MAG: hypothetical protein HRT89_01030 [Lentisphaeria bacterium]|nr:hypothetical protein [Lentisphaeria bacterium]